MKELIRADGVQEIRGYVQAVRLRLVEVEDRLYRLEVALADQERAERLKPPPSERRKYKKRTKMKLVKPTKLTKQA